jgi:hypothetical protein
VEGSFAEFIAGERGCDFGEGAHAEAVLECEYVLCTELMAVEEGDTFLEAGQCLLECALLNFHYNSLD